MVKSKNNVVMDWKILFSCLLFIIVFSNDVAGQVTYRATEDALKQLVKDIEALRKAPIGKENTSNAKGKVKGLLGGTYVTKRGDTLNQIIQSQVSVLPLRRNIIRLAIVRANPHAFKRNNPNWMYAGKTLRLPSVDDIRSVVFRSDKTKQKNFSSNRDSWIKYP